MPLETWKSIADWATIVLIALTVVSGSAALIMGDRINEKQTEQSRKFDEDLTAAKTELARAQKETADAQLALRKYIDDAAIARGPRRLDFKKFVAELRGKPKGTVQIWFAPNDEEAFELALQINRWLGPGDNGDGVGWTVREPKPIPAAGGIPEISTDAPPGIRYGAMNGMAIIANRLPSPPLADKTALGALTDALLDCGLPHAVERIASLPDGFFILVIGQKR